MMTPRSIGHRCTSRHAGAGLHDRWDLTRRRYVDFVRYSGQVCPAVAD
jgi:hypothetical protein